MILKILLAALLLILDCIIRFQFKDLLTQAALGKKSNKRAEIHASRKLSERLLLNYLPAAVKRAGTWFQRWYLFCKIWLYSVFLVYCAAAVLIAFDLEMWLLPMIAAKLIIIIILSLQFDSSRNLKRNCSGKSL